MLPQWLYCQFHNIYCGSTNEIQIGLPVEIPQHCEIPKHGLLVHWNHQFDVRTAWSNKVVGASFGSSGEPPYNMKSVGQK